MKQTYGQEWQTSEMPPPQEVLDYLRQKVDALGTHVLTKIVNANDENHWWINCEATDPHSHIYMKWTSEPQGITAFPLTPPRSR